MLVAVVKALVNKKLGLVEFSGSVVLVGLLEKFEPTLRKHESHNYKYNTNTFKRIYSE